MADGFFEHQFARPRVSVIAYRQSARYPQVQQPAPAQLSGACRWYNGFLAAGLFLGLSLGAVGTGVKVFFLLCVLVAGRYDAATASRKILFIQAILAAVGLALVLLA